MSETNNKTRETRPKVAEILAHTAYPDTIWNLTPTQSGQLPVAAGRGGPFKIDWEVHGKGDIKLVVSIFSYKFFLGERMLFEGSCT